MIQANELRIGNWVNLLGVPVVITADHIKAISDGDTMYEPIPLSPEILENAGFEQTMYGKFSNDKIGSLTHIKNYGYDLDDTESYSVNSVPILYVHQLQNLYFPLTGEELLIKF